MGSSSKTGRHGIKALMQAQERAFVGRVCKTTRGVCESNSSTARRTLGCDCEVGPTLRLPRCASTGPVGVRLAERATKREREREVGPPWYRLGRALRAQSTRTCVYSWCVYTGLRACFYGTSRQAERQFKRTCASSAEWATARPRPARLSWPVPARLAIKPNKASIKGRLEGRLAIVRLGAGRAAGRPPHFRGATQTRSGEPGTLFASRLGIT
jgi:hypothetical protein